MFVVLRKSYPIINFAMSTLSPGQTALARSQAYQLFSQLFLNGLSAETLPVVQQIPELAATLPETVDLERAASDHYRLFGLNLFPFQSVFLDSNGLVGGTEADGVAAAYAECGFVPLTPDTSVDHVGQELACLAFLCAAEADALEDQQPAILQRIQRLQKRFLDHHLLRWLPPLACALQRQQAPFYATLAELLLGLVDSQLTMLAESHALAAETAPFHLPDPPDLLAKGETSLRDIAIYLLRPAWCGMLLTRQELTWIGRALHIPAGFAERETHLVNLLRTAGQYEQFSALLHQLRECIVQDKNYYTSSAFISRSLNTILAVWLQRLDNAEKLLKQLDLLAVKQLAELVDKV